MIDEISMVSAEMLYMIDEHLKLVKGSSEPFGGIQIVMAGDFFQSAPCLQCCCYILDHLLKARISVQAATHNKDLQAGGDGKQCFSQSWLRF